MTYGGENGVYLYRYNGTESDLWIRDDAYDSNTQKWYQVVGIRSGALQNPGVTSLWLPNTLKYIEENGISHLGITKLELPAGLEMLEPMAIVNNPGLKTYISKRNQPTGYYGNYCLGYHLDEMDTPCKDEGVIMIGPDMEPDSELQNWCAEYGIAFQSIPTPANPRWNGTTAVWDVPAGTYENTDCYRLLIYQDGQYAGQLDASSGSIDVLPVMKNRGAGKYTFVVNYYGGPDSVLSPEYTYSGQVNSFRLTFDANGGSGSMEEMVVDAGTSVPLPACGFAPPSADKEFDHWRIDGDTYIVGQGYTPVRDVIVQAIWKDKGDPGVIYAAEMPDVILPEAVIGYEEVSAPRKAIVISNTGNQSIRDPQVTLSDDINDAFILSQSSVPAMIGAGTECTAWEVRVRPGLPIGTYTAKVTLTADALLEPVTANVTLTVRDHHWSTGWDTDYNTHWHPCLDEG
nr:hypothetical protein [Clostridiales bacterium]